MPPHGEASNSSNDGHRPSHGYGHSSGTVYAPAPTRNIGITASGKLAGSHAQLVRTSDEVWYAEEKPQPVELEPVQDVKAKVQQQERWWHSATRDEQPVRDAA